MGSGGYCPLPAQSLKPLSISTSHPPSSGHITASGPSKYQNKAQTAIRSGEDNPRFDRKHLDILHEQRVRRMSDKARNRVVFLCWERIYSEPYTASDLDFSDSVFGFFGICVPR